MNVNYTAEELAFRDEVRAFLTNELPADIAAKVKLGKHMSKEDHQRWQQILVKRGWYAPGWPVELGGTTWGPVEKHIFDEECAEFGAPRTVPFGVNMVAPVIIKFGSQQQKDHYLPRILSGEDWWCQGYSEPGAGSDLASLKTRAVRDGDHYVVNGQKTWTTLGQHANMIFVLARTDPDAKKQAGISFFLLDMKTPGITVRPIQTIDGGTEINEVFFDDVCVPGDALVGEENKGWDYAKFLLGNARWMDPVTEDPRLNTTEIWNFINTTPNGHPMHVHLVTFEVLSRRAFDIEHFNNTGEIIFTGPEMLPPNENGRRDMVRVPPGTVVQIIAHFDIPGEFVYHCHFLDHEDHEMMRPFRVVPAEGEQVSLESNIVA